LNDLATKDFVTGLHVAEVDVSESVRKQGKDPVAYRMQK